MATICPGCYRKIGETAHCATCRTHNDPNAHCSCPECDTDAHNDDAAIAAHEEDAQSLDDWRNSASYREQMEEARDYLRGERIF